MRCFIAVDMDPSLTQKVKPLQDQIKGLGVKLTEENNLHFTLKFLGEVDESTIKEIKKRLSEIADNTDAFSITLRGVGVFPSEKFIRVVWVGCRDKEFADMHNSVNTTLAKLFKKENATPHLTIARVRSSRDNQKIMEFVGRYKNAEIGVMKVDKIRLKKSTLTKKGPVYEDLAEFELK